MYPPTCSPVQFLYTRHTHIHNDTSQPFQVNTSFSFCKAVKVSSSWPGMTRPLVMRSRCFRRWVLRNLWNVEEPISEVHLGWREVGHIVSFFPFQQPSKIDGRNSGGIIDLPCWVVSGKPSLRNTISPLNPKKKCQICFSVPENRLPESFRAGGSWFRGNQRFQGNSRSQLRGSGH